MEGLDLCWAVTQLNEDIVGVLAQERGTGDLGLQV